MTRAKVPCVLFALTVFTVGISCAAAQAETIETAVQTAVQYHPSIEAARAKKEFSAEEAQEQYSNYFPQISVNATGGRIFGDNATSRGLSTTRGAGYSYLRESSVTARQKLFDGFQTGNRVDSAEARENSAALTVLDTQERIALGAVQAYIDLMRARNGLILLLEHKNVVDDYTQRLSNMIDQGGADEAQLQQARDIQVILEGLIVDYTGQVKTAESNYFEVTGRLPEDAMSRPAPHAGLIPASMDEALAFAKDNHPSLRSAAFTAESSRYDIDAEEAALYPSFDGELSYLKSDKADIIGGEVVDTRAVVRMNWNFETGGGQLDRISKRKKQYMESKARLEEMQRQIERGIRLAYSEYDTATKQLDVQQRRRALNQKLFETNTVQFDGGIINLLQLMQSHNQYFTTGLEQMNGEYRLLAAQYGILASMGKLQESFTLAVADGNPHSGQ